MSPTPRTLEDWLAHCERLHTVGIDMGLERVGEVWRRSGVTLGTPLGQEPADGAPVVFTVAGTNGTGSTCAMLESILIASGCREGVYGSPHLVHFEERCAWAANWSRPMSCCRTSRPSRPRVATPR